MEIAAKTSVGGIAGDIDVASEKHCRDAVTALPSVLDLTQAQILRDAMLVVLSDRSVLLDAGAVERMSTPCAQVLLAAGRAADLASSSFQITGASDAFRTALADLGLQAEFEKWMI